MVKLSYYAGNISLSTAQKLTVLYDHCKRALDSQGLGWASASPELVNYSSTVFPLLLNASADECNELLSLEDSDDDGREMELIALPRVELEDNGNELVNILLPFRRRRVFNLHSQLSSFIFVRYFVAATKCHEIGQVSVANFNRKLYRWTRDHVVPHLNDERLYPGLGGVLRVMRTIKAADLNLTALSLSQSKTHPTVKPSPARKSRYRHLNPELLHP